MSKISIAGATTGTGTFTLASPATNTDRVLTLPDEAGTVLTTAGVPASAMPSGSVIQVVHFDYAVQQSFSVPVDVDASQATSLAATITPSSTSSKIFVLCSANIGHSSSPASVVRAFVQRTGASTANNTLAQSSSNTNWSHVVYTPEGQVMWPNTVMTWLDSPNSLSACTYTLRIGGNTTTSIVGLNRSIYYGSAWGSVSHLTLMEIAG